MVKAPRWAPAIVAALVLTGCGAAGSDHPSTRSEGADAARLAAGQHRFPGWKTDFSRAAVPLSEFQSGGPPRDGIPPIDHPKFVEVAAADRFLDARDPVIAVEVRGAARAYPVRILVWHEIVNDRLGGTPIAVTYCPLCNSALVFDRTVGGRELRFGTTGKLRNSDLVMWDRQTESWWQQFNGTALVGRLKGTRLRGLDSQVLSWRDFRTRYPSGSVLSRETGFDRDYGRSPYPGYETPRERPFLYDGRLDSRLPPKERVVLVESGANSLVVPFSRLERRPVVVGDLAGRRFVVFFSHGVASVLDRASITASKDIGTVGVFEPSDAGRALTFVSIGGGRFRDRQTGSTWDITGHAVEGTLRGHSLRPLRHDEQFWFAVAAFLPKARIAR